MSITHFDCAFVALGIQHEKHARCVILSAVSSLVVPYFSTLSQKLHDFRKKKIRTQNVCFDFLYKFTRDIFNSVNN